MSASRIDSNGRADNINHAVLHGKEKKAVRDQYELIINDGADSQLCF